MACLKLTTLVILMSVIFLLSCKTGFGMKQPSTCRPVCTGSDCITVNQERVDFKTAEEACRDNNGELMTLQPETDENILDNLSQELFGNFWIGLHLAAGTCSNLSAPLRGYEWTSGSTPSSFVPSFGIWKDSIKVCSPSCVSLSKDQMWTERPCLDKIDGYLCRTKHKDACQAQELSEPRVFKSSKGCSAGPCEHICKDVEGGYECSCFTGYSPDSKDPRQCKVYCGEQKCPIVCDTHDSCSCPSGFVRNEKFCVDIDECEMRECAQGCENTFGSFVCSCKEGFVLKGQVHCVKAEHREGFVITTPITTAFLQSDTNLNTVRASSTPAGGLLWIRTFIALAVAIFISVVLFC
ncbi:fibrillin-3-like [Toxotes jaculatrix]|uniref:fibrillin-3-like n=1 Tax=Toxotes jaculatrix TaxID=941984 RepID=UPI001B3AC6EC|nr:fibrillin-3-like [Toxotes jaculatrix]